MPLVPLWNPEQTLTRAYGIVVVPGPFFDLSFALAGSADIRLVVLGRGLISPSARNYPGGQRSDKTMDAVHSV